MAKAAQKKTEFTGDELLRLYNILIEPDHPSEDHGVPTSDHARLAYRDRQTEVKHLPKFIEGLQEAHANGSTEEFLRLQFPRG